MVAEAAAAGRGALREPRGVGGRRGPTSRPGPGRPASRCCRRGVATGHTMDDQAETVLVNLLRGAGADGLAGMEPGPRHPLLGLRRRETHALCAAAGLVPVCDPSNDDPAFVRNRVRHELLPLCADVAGRDPVPAAGPAGRRAARRGRRCSRRWPPRRCPTRPTPGPLARRPAPAGPPRPAALAARRGRDGDHPPSLAEVDRVLAVAAGDAVGTELSGGRRVRRTGGRLRVEPRRAPVVSRR